MQRLGLNPSQDELDDLIRDIKKDMDEQIDRKELEEVKLRKYKQLKGKTVKP